MAEKIGKIESKPIARMPRNKVSKHNTAVRTPYSTMKISKEIVSYKLRNL
jgi:hypothetical protein